VRSPRLVLLDEPFDSVDAATRRVLTEQILQLAARGVAIVVTAHSSGDWNTYATHEIELISGRVQYCGITRQTHGCAPRKRQNYS
jgi:ABC-type multidrug transport system ATPase subunit